jgi:hypothetical protein
VQVAAFQQHPAQADGGIICVRKKGVFDNYTSFAAGSQDLDEVLEKKEGCLTGLDRKVLLYLGALLSTKWRFSHHNIVAVFFLDIRQVFCQRIGMFDIGGFDAMQDHIHDPDDVGQRLLFLAVKGPLLECFKVSGGQFFAGFRYSKLSTKKPADPPLHHR